MMDPTRKHEELRELVNQAAAWLQDQKALAKKHELSPSPSQLIDLMRESIGDSKDEESAPKQA